MRNHQKKDVCIIGLGASGGIIAAELAKAGMSVVGLEAGPYFKREVFEEKSAHDELSHVRLGRLRWSQPEVVSYNGGSPSTFPLIARNIGVGGPLHWSCFSYRFHESDFKVKAKLGDIKGASVEDWPIRYQDLEPYYELAERVFGVAGEAGENPFEAPRKNPYQMPPIATQLAGDLFKATASELGYHPFSIPAAITTEPGYGGKEFRQPCNYCGKCTFYGCEQHSKGTNLVATLPEALKTGNLEVRPGSFVTQITVDHKGQANSVVYLDETGEIHDQPARMVVVSNNAAYVARLLLFSKSDRFPSGLANSSGLVGKNLMFHSSVIGYGTFDQELNPEIGPQAAMAFDDLNEDRPREHYDQNFVRGGQVCGGIPLAFTGGPLAWSTTLGSFVPLPAGIPSWGQEFKDFIVRYYSRHFSISTLMEDLPSESNRIELDLKVTDKWGVPVPRIVYDDHPNTLAMQQFYKMKVEELFEVAGANSAVVTIPTIPAGAAAGHVMGTTRMGEDPERSVANSYGQTHDVSNLFIGGSSLFVTSAGLNPTLTIFALSYRTAEQMVKLWRQGAFH